uniref:Uncharacterized protein n=1 Tax=Haemonchus placei TaxID=6290 RepID=A0A0N4VU57_HAEPC
LYPESYAERFGRCRDCDHLSVRIPGSHCKASLVVRQRSERRTEAWTSSTYTL